MRDCRGDPQRERVYRWQTSIPDGGRIKFENAQAIVDHIWADQELSFPPKVLPLHPNMKKAAGKANRLNVWLQAEVSLRTIIHELAHSMSMEIDDSHETCGHGPWFMGLYTKMIEKYLNVPLPLMLYTCNKDNVEVNIHAYPLFLDD
jgi:hypothetical protein